MVRKVKTSKRKAVEWAGATALGVSFLFSPLGCNGGSSSSNTSEDTSTQQSIASVVESSSNFSLEGEDQKVVTMYGTNFDAVATSKKDGSKVGFEQVTGESGEEEAENVYDKSLVKEYNESPVGELAHIVYVKKNSDKDLEKVVREAGTKTFPNPLEKRVDLGNFTVGKDLVGNLTVKGSGAEEASVSCKFYQDGNYVTQLNNLENDGNKYEIKNIGSSSFNVGEVTGNCTITNSYGKENVVKGAVNATYEKKEDNNDSGDTGGDL